MIPAQRPQQILRPVTTGLIVVTIIGALLANLVPLPAGAIDLRPDFCALVLLYWGIQQPRRVGFTIVFMLGLLVDLADGSVLGQHSLAYVVLYFAAIALHRRVLNFGFLAQGLHVFPLLLGAELITVAARVLAGNELPTARHFLGVVISAALWAPLCTLLRLPRLPKTRADL